MAVHEQSEPSKKGLYIKIGVIVVVVIATIAILVKNSGITLSKPPPELVWYYDVNDKKMIALADSLNPQSNGHEVVRVYAYRCTGCADPAAMTVAYYERLSPEAIEELKSMQITTYAAFASEPWNKGRTVSRQAEGGWVDYNSKEGTAIVASIPKCPDGKPAKKICVGPKSE